MEKVEAILREIDRLDPFGLPEGPDDIADFAAFDLNGKHHGYGRLRCEMEQERAIANAINNSCRKILKRVSETTSVNRVCQMNPAAPPLDFRWLTWPDVIATGIEDRQLRNGLKRGLIKLGDKRNGRMSFSLRERFAIDIVARLTEAFVPISTASRAALTLAKQMDWLEEFALQEDGQFKVEMIAVLSASDDDLRCQIVQCREHEMMGSIVGDACSIILSLSRAYNRQVLFAESISGRAEA